ncbi:hypothetical protein R3X27_24690 [Tropicimonas sp. TH_r6]|uniref:hypothetical protein n=1 Tax=Tropicimonas sp. TH_r6 TaxID=3082085 RepID=UPI002952F71C|nr:hypothetical protein [Tropicimonas sp. TH_r6]MDV7145890.1 hypothetical protein [Tropicimonas sp. TH_r6]
MISENRTANLMSQLRYAEARALLIAGFSAWMLPDLGRELNPVAAISLTAPALLSALSWLAILANYLYSRGVNLHYDELDQRDELRALEYLHYRQSKYLRISLTASCLSVVLSTLSIGFNQFYWF